MADSHALRAEEHKEGTRDFFSGVKLRCIYFPANRFDALSAANVFVDSGT